MGQFHSSRQRELFRALEKYRMLIFAAGPAGISANYEGQFKVTTYSNEDRLEGDDGTFHVHIEWNRVKRITVEEKVIEGRTEGMLTFWDGEERLFRLYNPSRPFSAEITAFAGSLE